MPTEDGGMPVQARRVFRLALTMALALLCAYALAMPLPFLAPLFALMLCATPGPPLGLKQLTGLLLVIALTLGSGLLLIPLLLKYPATGMLVVAVGLFFSFFLTVNRGKGLVGLFLAVGLTMISAAGTVSFVLASSVIKALGVAIVVAVLCHWVAYTWFPEQSAPAAKAAAKAPAGQRSLWIAVRATLIVWPVYFFVLTNPFAYMPLLMKSVQLGQLESLSDTRHAARELLGSTLLAGCLAVLFWLLLKLAPSLWLFFWLMLAFGMFIAARLYAVHATGYPASFWQNTGVTLLILLGPAVEDSSNGNDVYMAFAIRMALFIAITLYALFAMHLLEQWRRRRLARRQAATPQGELSTC